MRWRRMRRVRASVGDSLALLLREYAEALAIAIVIALLLRFVVISPYRIPTFSMMPNLQVGDVVLGSRLPYSLFGILPSTRYYVPKRNQMIVLQCPQNLSMVCIRRVVGLPGDRIEMIKKRLLVNGRLADYAPAGAEALSGIQSAHSYAVLYEDQAGAGRRQIVIGQARDKENMGAVIVPPHHIFVLADNRDMAEDSRTWGPVAIRQAEARPLWILFSLDWQRPWLKGTLPGLRWERMFQSVN